MHIYGIDRDLKENRQPLLDRIEAWLRSALAEQLGIAPQAISLHTRFKDYGLDSVQATALLARLGAYLQRPLPVALLWSHPSPAELAQALAGQAPTSHQPAPTSAPHTQPIAVVGMS